MTANHLNSVEMLKAFAEAGNALEELPKVKADLSAAMELLNETETTLDSERSKNDLLAATIAELHAELSAKEAALADATKSREEALSIINSVRSLLPSFSDRLSSAAAVASGESDSATQGQSDSDPTSQNTSATTSEPHVDASYSGAASPSDAENTPSSTNPTEVANTATHANPSENSTQSSAEHTHRDGPTESHGTTPQDATAQTSTHEPASVYDGYYMIDEPFKGKPYWSKPNDMTWTRFSALGGNIPGWITDPHSH